jgi:predicted amidohydrolase YtcJ
MGKAIIFALVLLLFPPTANTQRPPTVMADLVLTNGKIVTVDREFSIKEAVAIKDGKILETGTNATIRALTGTGTRTINLQGKTVIPGLIDSHLHGLRAGLRWPQEVRLDEARTIADVLEAVKKKVAGLPAGKRWILNTGGWIKEQFRERRLPTRQELDGVAPNNAVYLTAFAEGTVIANSAALRLANISRDTKDPAGGRIERDPRTGDPTGVLKDTAMALVTGPALAESLTLQDKMTGTQAFMRDLNRTGVTGWVDTGGLTFEAFDGADYDPVFALWRKKEMTTRVGILYNTYRGTPSVQRILREPEHKTKEVAGDDYLTFLGSGEQTMQAFYTPPCRPSGGFKVTDENLAQLKDQSLQIARSGGRFSHHSGLTETITRVLDVWEAVDKEVSIKNLRWSLEHVFDITPQELARAKALGVAIGLSIYVSRWTVCPGGPPVQTIANSGVMAGGGTDGTIVAPYVPFIVIYYYVTGKHPGGELTNPGQRMTRPEALRAFTNGSAWFMKAEDKLGSIEPGKLADLAVLSDDYLTVAEDKIRDITSVMTIVGGRIVFEGQK